MVHNFPKGLSPFYMRVYEIVDDPSSDSIISWSNSSKNSFVIWNLQELHRDILKSSVELGGNLATFVSELWCYGFKRIKGSEQWEFGHDDFLKGHPELLEKMMLKTWTKRNRRFGALLKTKIVIAKPKRLTSEVTDRLQRLQLSSQTKKGVAKSKKPNADVTDRFQRLRI